MGVGEAVPWACVPLLVLVPEKRVLGEKRQLVWQVYTRRGFGRELKKRTPPPRPQLLGWFGKKTEKVLNT